MSWQLFTDGGSRGNPGPGACAYVLYNSAGKVQEKCGKYLGVVTNNQAEYDGLLFGLEAAQKLQIDDLSCFLDSELVVKQLNGEYRIKDGGLKVKALQILKIKAAMDQVTFNHIPRAKNFLADKLVNDTLDTRS